MCIVFFKSGRNTKNTSRERLKREKNGRAFDYPLHYIKTNSCNKRIYILAKSVKGIIAAIFKKFFEIINGDLMFVEAKCFWHK